MNHIIGNGDHYTQPYNEPTEKTYRDLDYNQVVDWADERGINTDTPENWREAAIAMFEENNS